jgi:hypothetical protein
MACNAAAPIFIRLQVRASAVRPRVHPTAERNAAQAWAKEVIQ